MFISGVVLHRSSGVPACVHWFLIALALRRRFLERRDCSGVSTDMFNDALAQRFFDQGLMHLLCEVVLGKFGKGLWREKVDSLGISRV